MHPHRDTALEERPAPGLDVFADAMRSVLRVRHDSPGDGPEALEAWTRAGGYVWRWTTEDGQWRVTAGEVADPRPLLHGPGGFWRVDAQPDEQGADLVLFMLRAAGAIPAADPAPDYAEDWRFGERDPRRVAVRPVTAVVRGETFVESPAAEPLRAVLHRASDPAPELPAGYIAVRATSDHPDAGGRWDVVLPDGYHHHTYDPARRCLVPYQTDEGGTELLLFEPGRPPGGGIYPVRSNAA